MKKLQVKDGFGDQAYAFTKVQFVKSVKYAGSADILNALLEDDKKYTEKEVDSIIAKFMKGAV